MYLIEITPSALKDYRKIPQLDTIKINSLINSLSQNPRPSGCKKLENRSAYRVRSGNYRIIYEISDNILTVCVIRIRHRKDVYK
ncbi:MAG TPA: type II toxin-antitoxin system RelE/ParE family toxin [Spirochaetota bacterium]|nr:type II toxin-antitoxin system RelE/ParE family toxin [Spirochaetota bacterium]HOR44762.1 type II toxin-antitoxin system RelE/ParE family toxin [Spirochaetota bacterium]HOU84555.1 type II toxin-antitoxin system RelE/ParE family toxin [Spirochaetota bacterium]HPK56282.1 type II toxin-antitoxin system RelE/ParE family toxin [Spirochaetota bacterium]HQE58035.1 type II toxin-antitoxin system RelE/ParE family toxin [Spirochaetota bacterium]